MAYMSRLGIWGKGTPFQEFGDFIQAVERRFVPVNMSCILSSQFAFSLS